MNFCFAKGNEAEFIKIALALKLKEICFVYDSVKDIKNDFLAEGIKIYTALVFKGKKIDKNKEKVDYVVAESSEKTRNTIENKYADFIYDLENSPEADMIHFRNSGLNQVTSKLCKEKNITVVFNFNLVLKNKARKRAVILGRMQQNFVLCRKYKVKHIIGNFAKKPEELRSEKALKAFESLF